MTDHRQNHELRLSLVMPSFNSSSTLLRAVDAALMALGSNDEFLIADDGSTDGSIAEVVGDDHSRIRIIRSEVNIGRGPARNMAAHVATGDVIVFIDSDVALHPDSLERIRTVFTERPDVDALIGSYDASPGHSGIVSRYRNLLHHHTHQSHPGTASHFWTGLGAIRRSTFEEIGGLDTDLWARNLEDVEFGHRVRDAGHEIHVMPEIQGSHLKAFTTRSMVHTDLRERAIPWSNLIMSDGFRVDHFVVSWTKVISVLCVAIMGLSVVALPWFTFAPCLLALAIIVFLVNDASLWRLVHRRYGFRAALTSIPLHVIHSFVCGLGVLMAIGNRTVWILKGRRPENTPAGDIRSRRWFRGDQRQSK